MVSCSAFQLRLAAWAATESIKVSHAVLLEHMSFLQTLCVCVCVCVWKSWLSRAGLTPRTGGPQERELQAKAMWRQWEGSELLLEGALWLYFKVDKGEGARCDATVFHWIFPEAGVRRTKVSIYRKAGGAHGSQARETGDSHRSKRACCYAGGPGL